MGQDSLRTILEENQVHSLFGQGSNQVCHATYHDLLEVDKSTIQLLRVNCCSVGQVAYFWIGQLLWPSISPHQQQRPDNVLIHEQGATLCPRVVVSSLRSGALAHQMGCFDLIK